ncbi:hypothetical protein BT69DRAFT_1403767 [Atractiella rhizophila]|nr:hypothetical protein BT69DRAFT_1403767 [Atractiella rhizophila]
MVHGNGGSPGFIRIVSKDIHATNANVIGEFMTGTKVHVTNANVIALPSPVISIHGSFKHRYGFYQTDVIEDEAILQQLLLYPLERHFASLLPKATVPPPCNTGCERLSRHRTFLRSTERLAVKRADEVLPLISKNLAALLIDCFRSPITHNDIFSRAFLLALCSIQQVRDFKSADLVCLSGVMLEFNSAWTSRSMLLEMEM